LAAIARGEPVRIACRAAGCSRQALYRRRITDLAFDRNWRDAESAARTQKEKSRPRKRIGATLPVFAPRGPRGHKRVLSDGLLLARLKAVRPLYRDRLPGGATAANVVAAGDDDATIQLFRHLVHERKVSLAEVPARVRLHCRALEGGCIPSGKRDNDAGHFTPVHHVNLRLAEARDFSLTFVLLKGPRGLTIRQAVLRRTEMLRPLC